MTFDKATRDALTSAIERGIRERMELYQEEWLSPKDLCQRMPMFKTDWLSTYGYKLPRERIVTITGEQSKRCSQFMYPLHRIQRLVADGYFREIHV